MNDEVQVAPFHPSSFRLRTSLPPGQVIDVFTAAGLPKPDISILSDQFLAEVRRLRLDRRHLAGQYGVF